MHTSLRKVVIRHTRVATILAALSLACLASVSAEEMEMPNAAEVQYFSPEAQQFYSAGIAALDRADYGNAYNMLAKAAALQPTSIRLNHITAKLAIHHGRQNSADLARDYYQTAIFNYENMLSISTLTGDLRRQITNELKATQQEASELAQRDALREATGTTFMLDWNRQYASQTPRAAGTLADATAATTLTQTTVNPITQMMMQDPNQMQGGMMVDPDMPNTGMMQGGMGMPGAGMPGAAGMPGGAGMPGPINPPAGVAPGGPGMGLPGPQQGVPGGQPTQPGVPTF